MVSLDVKLALADGAQSGFIRINRHEVDIRNGKGSARVNAELAQHSYRYFCKGNGGGTISIEILQGSSSRAKGKSTISADRTEATGRGTFTLSAS
jgi:hypothetical protein